MKKGFKRANKKVVDGIKFDSPEEIEVYEAIKNKSLDKLTGIEELKSVRLVNAEPPSFILYEGFKAGQHQIRKRVYTHDFDILINKELVHLEIKSKWTEGKADYRLRRAMFLYIFHKTNKFAELIKIKKGVWEFKKYY